MRTFRFLTLALVGLLCIAGFAFAQEAHGGADVASDDASAGSEFGRFENGNYADLDANAATDEAGGMVDADASHADLEDEAGPWTWFSLNWSTFVSRLNDLVATLGLGLTLPGTNGGADVYASDDGIDLDAKVGDIDFDDSPLGDADGKTWQTMSKAHDTASNLPADAPELPNVPDTPELPETGDHEASVTVTGSANAHVTTP